MKNYAARVLVEELSLGQARLLESRFVAPHVPPSGVVKTRLHGMLYSFTSQQSEFEGWGVFRPRTNREAQLVATAEAPLIDSYLSRFPSWEMRLIRPLRGRTWLAQARHSRSSGPRPHKGWFNPSDGPMTVHLVQGASPFTVCRARFDGRNMWYEGPAPTADPRLGDALLRALSRAVSPQDLRVGGLTQLDRSAYSLEFLHCYPGGSRPESQAVGARPQVNNEQRRLESALARGGGGLRSYADNGEAWVVHWIDSHGELHTSTIIKRDLSVVSAGICLSGEDSKFDLTSLVGVVEGF